MDSIIVAFHKNSDAHHISNILKRRGIETSMICTTGTEVLSQLQRLKHGIVICGNRLADMHYSRLYESLPKNFEMILLASAAVMETCPSKITALAFPIKPSVLADTVETLLMRRCQELKRQKVSYSKRTEQEQNYINNAKWILMEHNGMTEQEAFRYIQKCSMDSGTNMVETAQMILLMICEF